MDIHCRYCTVYRMFLCSPHRISKWPSGIGWQYTGESHLSYSVHRIGHDFSPFLVVHMGFLCGTWYFDGKLGHECVRRESFLLRDILYIPYILL